MTVFVVPSSVGVVKTLLQFTELTPWVFRCILKRADSVTGASMHRHAIGFRFLLALSYPRHWANCARTWAALGASMAS